MRLVALVGVSADVAAMVRTRSSPWASRMVGWAWMSRFWVQSSVEVEVGSKPP